MTQTKREPITHTLKTDSDVFHAVADGRKKFEIRKADRDFRVGDRLNLLETAHTGAEMAAGAPLEYTGGQAIVTVTHIMHGPCYGLADGRCLMSIEDVPCDFNPDAVLSRTTTRALPHPGSPEASAMMDSVLAEYNWPANSKNAARAGWEAANRWLSRPAGAAEAPSDMDYGNNMQIAVEKDGIRQLAAQAVRVETGPVQFGDDWPGVFIRGDNAFGYVGALDAVLRRVDDPMAHILIQSLRDVLSRSDLTGLSRASAQTAAPAPAEALTPPEFQEATWGIDSVMRPVRGMAVSEFAFREWAKENGIRLSASPTASAAVSNAGAPPTSAHVRQSSNQRDEKE